MGSTLELALLSNVYIDMTIQQQEEKSFFVCFFALYLVTTLDRTAFVYTKKMPRIGAQLFLDVYCVRTTQKQAGKLLHKI